MPHAVIDGPLELAAFAAAFEPLLVRRGGELLRTGELFVERGGRALLIEALVVESGRKQPFYVRIASQERGSTSVRVDPHTHPDRTPGVHALVGEIVRALLDFAPAARLSRGSVVVPSAGPDLEDTDEDRQ
jgi:hypothetical protein